MIGEPLATADDNTASGSCRSSSRERAPGAKTYSGRGGLLVAGLASHLEGNAIGSGVLELEGGGREVVEVLVEQL